MNRGERRRRTENVVAKRIDQCRDWDRGRFSAKTMAVPCKERCGMRKRHPFDCGKPLCGVCHPHKHPSERHADRLERKRETAKEIASA